MKELFSSLHRYRVFATDEELGGIKDVFVDSRTWEVAYLSVSTHKWLPGKSVLVPTKRVLHLPMVKALAVNLPRRSICGLYSSSEAAVPHQSHSQHVNNSLGVIEMFSGSIGLGYPFIYSYTQPVDDRGSERMINYSAPNVALGKHIHGAKILIGYHLHMLDDELGVVEDLVVNKSHWRVSHLIVSIKAEAAPARRVLLPTSIIAKVSEENRLVYTKSYSDTVTLAPTFSGSQVRKIDERLIEDHYAKFTSLSSHAMYEEGAFS